MKHEYHLTISRSDRIWLIVFVCFLLGWELIKPLWPEQTLPRINSSAFEFTLEDSASVVVKNDSFNATAESTERTGQYIDEQTLKDTIDIMQASWSELRQIGLSSKVASNITKYIAAGGIIRDEQALSKIYGMDSIQLMDALPYLKFPAPEPEKPEEKKNAKWNDRTYAMLDLNVATAVDLEALPGIGAVLAERIISYRTNLGGFHQVEQLSEVYGLPPETMDKIRDRLDILTPIEKLNINQADLTNVRHPYLQKKFLKMLVSYRNQHGRFEHESDIKKVFPPDTNWCEKLLPYLSYD